MIAVGDNSYITVEQADEINCNNERWLNLSTVAKEHALIMATIHIDGLMWTGWKTNVLQPLAWPRCGRPIPPAILTAQALEAAARANPELTARMDALRLGLRSVTVGNASESYGSSAGRGILGQQVYSEDALTLLRPFLAEWGAIV